jgi:unsaturated rhamnogalacturonyl hydrolase
MFVCALLKGVRMGYLPKNTYLPMAKKGFEGLIKTFIETDAAGKIHLTHACSGAGLGGVPYREGTYAYYIKEPQRTDDLKAVGPFIQAALEMALLGQE